jgi:hypothetical protein
MKKLFVLFLCLVAVAGFAGTVHPPGATALKTVLPGYGVHETVVTSDTVLATQPFLGLPASILVLSDTIYFTGQPHGYMIKPMEMVSTEPDYWLRL